MNKLKEILKIADIHVKRIEMAIDDLQDIIPLDENKIVSFSKQELLVIELLTSRFAKLQDLIGKKIIDEFLLSIGEFVDNYTMIDKINKLERLGIITSAEQWKHMRYVRNHIAHEYPDEPAITAKYLNQLLDSVPKLLNVLNNIKART